MQGQNESVDVRRPDLQHMVGDLLKYGTLFNRTAERAVLGGILFDNKALDPVLEVLGEDDFCSEANAKIFEVMVDLFGQGQPVDTVTVREQLLREGTLSAAGGDDYLLALTDTIPDHESVMAHARAVREAAILRRLVDACRDLGVVPVVGK